MLKRLARAYLRIRYGITEPWQRCKPPLGWNPLTLWYVPVRRRVRYFLAHRLWRLDCRVRDWAFRGEPDAGPVPFREGFSAWWLLRQRPCSPEHAAELRELIARGRYSSWLTLPEQVEYRPADLDLTDGAGI